MGPEDPLQSLKVGPQDPLQSLKEGPSIIFFHCLTYFVLDKYVYNMKTMKNSLADDVFILMEFRNAQKYSNWKYSTCTFRTLDNALLYFQVYLISNYSNSVILMINLLL